MNLRRIAAALAVCMIGSTSLAQDPMLVEPTHYKLAFENDRVQVVNVHYGPHEKSKMHSHPGGVVVYISSGHLKFTDENGNVKEVRATAGESRFFPPFRHTVRRTLPKSRLTRSLSDWRRRERRNSA